MSNYVYGLPKITRDSTEKKNLAATFIAVFVLYLALFYVFLKFVGFSDLSDAGAFTLGILMGLLAVTPAIILMVRQVHRARNLGATSEDVLFCEAVVDVPQRGHVLSLLATTTEIGFFQNGTQVASWTWEALTDVSLSYRASGVREVLVCSLAFVEEDGSERLIDLYALTRTGVASNARAIFLKELVSSGRD